MFLNSTNNSDAIERNGHRVGQLLIVLTVGVMIWMTPPQLHWQVEPNVSAGRLPTIVFAAPGFHGVVTGTQGIGVSTPSAAVVAAATVGFDGLMHIPNGGMLVMGAKSMIDAAGLPSTITRADGITLSTEGAAPKLHMSWAVAVTLNGIAASVCYLRDPLTDAVSLPPVVVTKQSTLRSLSCSQLRADGKR